MRTFNATVGQPCKLCDLPFKEGEKGVLVPIGPTDMEEIANKEAGRPYNTEAKEVHLTHMVEWLGNI